MRVEFSELNQAQRADPLRSFIQDSSQQNIMSDQPHDLAGNSEDEFVLEMINCQSRLYAYVLSLVFDKDRARDVLQQSNLILLEKKHEYQPGTAFGAWACKIAFYEVLAERRRNQRDRHMFSDELLALVAARSEHLTDNLDRRAEALEECVALLSDNQRQILLARYSPGGSVAEIAKAAQKTPGAISVVLHRVRNALLDCVQRKLNQPVQT